MNMALFPDVVVNGETIPSTAIAAEAQNHSAPRDKPGIAWRKAANAVALRTLLLQEAHKRGLVAEPQDVAPGQRETPDEALIRGVLDAEIAVDPPSEAAIRAEWARDPSRFRAPPLWEASHILLACDPADEAANADARAGAQALCDLLQSESGRFPELARQNSACQSRDAGGFLGQIGPGEMVPEFEAALRDLDEGKVTPQPVRTRYGWHVIRLDARAEGAVLPFDAVRPRIAEAMEKAAWTRAAKALIDRLVERAEISGADLAARTGTGA